MDKDQDLNERIKQNNPVFDISEVLGVGGSEMNETENESSSRRSSESDRGELDADADNPVDPMDKSNVEETSGHEGSAEKTTVDSASILSTPQPVASTTTKSSKRGPRKVAAYYENQKQRRDTFIRSGLSIEQDAKDLQTKTGCSIWYKAQFRSKNKVWKYSAGTNNFRIEGETPEALGAITIDDVNAAVTHAVSQELNPVIDAIKSVSNLSKPGSSTFTEFSPRKRAAPAKLNSCYICKKEDYTRDHCPFSSSWILCSFISDGKPCSNQAHCDCLWLPGLSNSEVETLPNMYCPEHIGYGRLQKDKELDTSASGDGSKAKKGRGRKARKL